jgi:hypothetical protein
MLTPAERAAFATGADFTELCAVSRREWERTRYAKRKAKLQARYEEGEIGHAKFATEIRVIAQEEGK